MPSFKFSADGILRNGLGDSGCLNFSGKSPIDAVVLCTFFNENESGVASSASGGDKGESGPIEDAVDNSHGVSDPDSRPVGLGIAIGAGITLFLVL